MALKYARIFKPKHRIYSLLTHQLIAIPAFIAVQTGAFSKCKIFLPPVYFAILLSSNLHVFINSILINIMNLHGAV